MLVSLITPHWGSEDAIGRRVRAQWHFFHGRGDEVIVYACQAAIAATGDAVVIPVTGVGQISERYKAELMASDLLVVHAAAPYALLDLLPRLERGAILFYFHHIESSNEAALVDGLNRYAAYADLVVAEGVVAAASFVHQHGYTALPVHVLPIDGETKAEDYPIYWAEAVATATEWLPNRPYPYGRLPALAALHPPPGDQMSPTPSAPPLEALAKQLPGGDLRALLDSPESSVASTQPGGWLPDAGLRELSRAADTMQRGYGVRSRIPILGPLIAWLRRNLTSHLREPYIDPTFRRQEAFNRLAVRTITELAGRQAAELSALKKRIAELERQLQVPAASQPGQDLSSLDASTEGRAERSTQTANLE